MPLQLIEFNAEDLKDPTLAHVNSFFRRVVAEVNASQGVNGPVKFLNGIDLGGNRIMNVGPAQAATDAINQDVANPLYGSPAQQKTMEAVGKNILQSTRRIGDPTQQDPVSSHMKSQGSVPPIVVSAIHYTATGTSITISPPSGDKNLYWADVTTNNLGLSPSFTVAGLTNGTPYFLYPFWDYKTGTIQLASTATGLGSPPVAYLGQNNAANQIQIADGHVPLSQGPITITPSPGGFGNVGGRTF